MSTGGVGYAVRIRWVSKSKGGSNSLGPCLNNLLQRQWIVFSRSDGTRQVVPGWDSRNDIDGDGYVNDSEFSSLINKQATARMRQESRVFTLGQMWSQKSSGCRVNAWNPILATYLADYLNKSWTISGLKGAYNDDLLKMLGPDIFPLSKGGMLAEYPGYVNSTDTSLAFQIQFTNILKAIIKTSKSKYISGNISGVNLFASVALSMFIAVLNLFLRESYLSAGLGLTGYFGIQKTWDTFAYAALQKKTIIQGQVSFGMGYGAITLVNRYAQSSWERDIASILAMYYLVNVPGSTSFQSWGNGYYYGSGNTFTYNYYKAGVPMNVAYQPTNMLKVDIGVPKQSISDLLKNPSREFMTFQTSTTNPSNGYTVIGNSTSKRLFHPEISINGYLDVIPSFIYYLQRAPDHPQIPTTPMNCILAREYTKGLVLYRTDVYGGSVNFLLSNVTVSLPGGDSVAYRRVSYDGSLGPVITSITLGGYESAILIDSKKISTSDDPSIKTSTRPSTSPTTSPTSNPTPPIDLSKFKLAWYYDFSTELSWDFNIYQGPFSSSSTTYFVKSNAKVTNKQLSLQINNNSITTNGKKYVYSSAGIGSWAPHSQIYGRWEVEAKFPPGFGVTGYIGLFPTNKKWPPEVDFGEVIGRQPRNLFLTQHYGANYTVHKQKGSVYVKNPVDWTKTFHVFALEWTPSKLFYYVDNILIYNQSVMFPPTPMDLAIGVGAGDCASWSWVNCPDNAISNGQSYPLPSTMFVNYIKKYTYVATPNPTIRVSSTPTVFPSVVSTKPPSIRPSIRPSNTPSKSPLRSVNPIMVPSTKPSSPTISKITPTTSLTNNPTNGPRIPSTSKPIKPSVIPSKKTITTLKTKIPSFSPSSIRPRSIAPSRKVITSLPTTKPSKPPTRIPSKRPISRPTMNPSISKRPSVKPSKLPSMKSTRNPSRRPTRKST